MKKILAVLFLVCILSQPICAQQRFVDENAALRYLLAIGYMPDFSTCDNNLKEILDLEAFKNLKPEIRKVLDNYERLSKSITFFRLLNLAADCSKSTFIVDKTIDEDTIVPPYSTLRLFAHFIIAMGWKAAEKGDYHDAAQRFVHVFRLGTCLGSDGLTIGGFFGTALQRLAVTSADNLLKITDDSGVKKYLLDYFSALPDPVIDPKRYLENELIISVRFLEKVEKNPELLVEYEIIKDEESKTRKKPLGSDLACAANQRVLLGAVEMYLMDNEKLPANIESDGMLKSLVDGQYLKSVPVCPNKGTYIFSFADSDNVKISCTCGSSIDTPAPEKSEKEVFSAAVLKRAEEYVASSATIPGSGQRSFAKDKKELEELFKEMLNLDAFAPDAEKTADIFAERIEKTSNPLIRTLVIKPSYLKTFRTNRKMLADFLDKLSK